MTKKLSVQEAFSYMDKRWRWMTHGADGVVRRFTDRPAVPSLGNFMVITGQTGVMGINIDIEPGQCIEREAERVRFGDLKPGDRFIDKSDEEDPLPVYIRIVASELANAIRLPDYTSVHYSINAEVTPIEGDDHD